MDELLVIIHINYQKNCLKNLI